jgi:hypothetical protein
MSDDDIQVVLERYSACRICNRESTKLCEESVDFLTRNIFFTTPYKRGEDEMTRYCKYFKLSTTKLNKMLGELSTTNERERIVSEKVHSDAST